MRKRTWLGALAVAAPLFLGALANADETADVRARFGTYLDTFNAGDAERLASFWAEDAVSLNESTGERVVGRDALLAEFQDFFASSPGAKLIGGVEAVRVVRPDVVLIEGVATVSTSDGEATPSAFTALLTKEGDQWLINSSQERDLPMPATPAEALSRLEWLIGEWRDEGADADVRTTVRWSPNKAFLLRSSHVDFADGSAYEGTQVIGWDPAAKQFRTWNFGSDGSFGEGTVVRSGGEWLMRMKHTAADGTQSSATQVVTKIDEDTLRFERFGETVNGLPAPSAGPITVVRVQAAEGVE